MKGLKRLVLVVLGVAAACAPAPPRDQPAAGPYERGVEVVNYARERVDVHYHLVGSTVRQYLGSVGAGGRERFLLPEPRVASIYATTSSGQIIPRRSALVQIRRVRL